MNSSDLIHLEEFVRRIRTADNADEIDWFAECVRGHQEAGNFPRRWWLRFCHKTQR